LPTIGDRDSAPIIFFDGATPFGHYNNIFHVTLGAYKHIPTSGGQDDRPAMEVVMVAFLRSNRLGMVALRDAINNALLLAEPTEGDAN
jgi:hypothetical protein